MVAVFVSLPSTSEAAPCATADGATAVATELVALGPRVDNSAEATAAVELLERHLRAAGLEPRREVIGRHDLAEIAVGPWVIRAARTALSQSENIWVRVGGDGPARVLMAHYDTVPGAPGAIDNAVAVGILLEAARCLATTPPPGPVVIAFTGGEERGLLGARRLALTLKDAVEVAISFDLVGHQSPLAVNGLSSQWGPARLRWLRDRVEAADVDAYAPLLHRLVSREMPQLERSDHGAFTERGIAAAHIYGRGRERIYLPYHTPLDDMSQVAPGAVDNALRLVVELIGAHAPLPEGNGSGLWINTPLGGVVVGPAIALPVGLILVIAAAVLILLCYQRRRIASRERAIGLFGVLLIFVAAFLVAAIVDVVEGIRHGNDMAPFHEPLRFTLGLLGVAVASFALISAVATRWGTFVRGTRYHATAAAIELVVGAGLLAAGALEIAWWPLVVAVLFSLAGRLLERPIACTVLSVCGIALALLPALDPSFLREAAYHGFFPTRLPIAAYLAVVSLTSGLALVGAVRARLGEPSRVVHVILALALVAAIGVSAAAVVVPEPRCTAADSQARGFTCELSGLPADPG